MADARLSVKVGAEVELEPGPVTAAWLVGLGWTPPEQSVQDAVTTRTFAALHQSAESDVSRVVALYEQWVADGAPPLGTSMARWWDKKLVELHNAIRTPESVPADDEDDYDPLPLELSVLSDIAEVEEALPTARPLRAMGGAETMRYRAARLRRDLMNEVSSPERVDEMLRNLDVDVEALAAVDCDC